MPSPGFGKRELSLNVLRSTHSIAFPKFGDLSERFDHHLLGYISGISKPPLDGCGQSFKPRKTLFHILTAWLCHPSLAPRCVTQHFAAKTQLCDPSSSEICLS